ncbi:Trifunctional nucleotide phosphoesterase protein YfkN precursor [Roseovarius albus]|uniref:Trifunctional nucleotide phosphoesterase protein YfkN n=2 Tax=Roseovarius albus TaxID=1247867 RepID=A0A1X6Y6C3_9RHOB|nr:Trifunctional nucleotide phosphoesterase protein YfkN precursor [Roseovarius albus]
MPTSSSCQTSNEPISPSTRAARLCVMQTTDLHGHLRAFDYLSDAGGQPYGLARLASLIKKCRREYPNCLLFDTGDFLQGTPLSDMTIRPEYGWSSTNPIIEAMNHLQYDAVALGNHEFNFGLDWLCQSISSANFPIICANLFANEGDRRDAVQSFMPPFVILKRILTDELGHRFPIRIGVLGLLPPQVTSWDQVHLQGALESRDMLETAQKVLPMMRSAGADLIVLLAHTGAVPSPLHHNIENAALHLAKAGGVDIILAGHTHQIFPQPDHSYLDGMNHQSSTFHDIPAIMAGFRGSHLGMLDLVLNYDDGQWRIAMHSGRVISAGSPDTHEDSDLIKITNSAHTATRRLIRKPIGRSDVHLHSYIARIRPDPSLAFVAQAKKRSVEAALKGTSYTDLPILAATSPFKTGGQAGPKYFSDVAPGDIQLRHLFDLYPFPNTLCALRLTGAEVLDWLERSVSCFNRLEIGEIEQPLLHPRFPGHNFDVIHGLSYTIDLSQPAKYRPCGQLAEPTSARISSAKIDGKEIDLEQQFIVSSNTHRVFGGGLYPIWAQEKVILENGESIRGILATELGAHSTLDQLERADWNFAPLPGTSAIFETGPGIRNCPDEFVKNNLSDLGDTETGFIKLLLKL